MSNPNLPIAGNYNTYIGARYVPLIMGIWSETVSYEPLSIVTYQGNSYTSKTFVPAGTPVSNETYWANTGNYNAQVEQYRQEVQELSSQINPLTENLSSQKFKGDTLIFGDSYVVPPNNFIQISMSNINKTNYDLVGTNGAAFSKNDNLSYYSIINNWLQSNQKRDYETIFIFSGANEIAGLENIDTNLPQTIQLIKNNFPNSKIYIGMYGTVRNTSANTQTMVNVSEKFYKNCIENNVFYIPNMTSPLILGDKIQADSVHPTQLGQNALATYFTQFLQNRNTDYIEIYNIPSNFISDDNISTTGTIINRNSNINMNLNIEINKSGIFNGYLDIGNSYKVVSPGQGVSGVFQCTTIYPSANFVSYGMMSILNFHFIYYYGSLSDRQYNSVLLNGFINWSSYPL